ncbi:MAG: hypothetical protein JNM56_39060, partial [Planctomycetia bacterium]|nr:hypothetical protein [Planctomycetia bacterium]
PPLAGLVIALLASLGCLPAGRYGSAPRSTRPQSVSQPQATQPAKATPVPVRPEPLSPDLAWMEPTPTQLERPIPIVFVHETSDRAEWNKLQQFWTPEPRLPQPSQVVGWLGGSPWLAAGLALTPSGVGQVKLKVPLGLDDPTAYIPPSNPLTLQKWELGKRLFFDPDHVLPPNAHGKKLSCASCHDPATGFTDKNVLPRNPPTLINSVYNAHQFWDGRASALEEVVQRNLEDERDTGADGYQRHAWSGVIGRLRQNKDYVAQFRRAFGTPPTQDAVGKALACYLRTILSGDSLHDRAEWAMKQRGSNQLEARDYEKVLDDAALLALQEPGEGMPAKAEVARELFTGWTLFHGKAGCVQCHGGRQFTDQGFHNIGEGDSNNTRPPGEEIGRFASLPPGLKDRRLIGAFKTPGLRALPRTRPYLHDGLRQDLFEVVHLHVKPAFGAPNLDPEIRERELTEGDKRALTRFLRALDGGPVPAETTAGKRP